MQILYMLPNSQWSEVKTILDPKNRKRRINLQTIFSGMVYLLENGYKWGHLPAAYGNAKTIWYYFNRWNIFGVLEQALYLLATKLRTEGGRPAEPSMLIVDSQSVKSHSPGSSENKGYDGGKKVSSHKRHLAVDSGCNPVAVDVSAANVHDKKGALTLKEQIEDLGRVKKIIADGSYRGIPTLPPYPQIRVGRRHPSKPAVKRGIVDKIFNEPIMKLYF